MIRWFKRTPEMTRRQRMGANAIEFALTLPMFVAITMGIVEYGWVYFNRSGIITALRQGCRDGALIHPEEIPSPEEVAEDSIKARMLNLGVDCSADPSPCFIRTEQIGFSPTEVVECEIDVSYTAITGVVPAPATLGAETIIQLELQR